ncbi:MAG: ATP-binding cassette domain-containing protein [Defluviitaleaceae bacterium]|nr:ATP-binding cassette domain-containing protein [Defluviitaleaceae bacterium]
MKLSVAGINKRFGEKHVLKDVSFNVESGLALGLLGRNGAGKTTTLRIVTDIFRADSGEITIDGVPMKDAKVRVGYLPEERGLYPKSAVGEQMVYIGKLKGLSSAQAKKNAHGLLEKLEAEEYWQKKLETLSKGNQQKIQLAIAVLDDPDVIILDEPFSGLDPVNASMLKKLIVEQVEKNKLVMFSSHQMPYVEEFCQHICIINKGSIVLDGNIAEIKRTYNREKISVRPEGPKENFTGRLKANAKFIEISNNLTEKGDSVIITLKDASKKHSLLEIFTEEKLQFDMFNVVEPTLEEIFVEKAGDAV